MAESRKTIIVCSRGYVIKQGRFDVKDEWANCFIRYVECANNHSHRNTYQFPLDRSGEIQGPPVLRSRDPIDIPFWGAELAKELGIEVRYIRDWDYATVSTLMIVTESNDKKDSGSWGNERTISVHKTDYPVEE